LKNAAFGLSPGDPSLSQLLDRFVLNTFLIVVTALVSQSLMAPHLVVAEVESRTQSMGGGHGGHGVGERMGGERKT
jgi:hypothetical protein